MVMSNAITVFHFQNPSHGELLTGRKLLPSESDIFLYDFAGMINTFLSGFLINRSWIQGGAMKKALLLVDIQNDFISGGALAVPDGDAVVPAANDAMKHFNLVVATQDWHPADHGSFAGQHSGRKPGDFIELNGLKQILWPDHCVMNTRGAEFAGGLALERVHKIFQKGIHREVDSYSGFFDNGHRYDTGLGDFLKEQAVEEIAIVGLATDYCVKHTAMDARKLGFRTNVIREGVRGVEIMKGDCEKAIHEMKNAGVIIVGMNELA